MRHEIKHYRDTYEEFASLLSYGSALIEAQTGLEAIDQRQFYAERIFCKLICHGISLKRLSPSITSTTSPELWDVSSNYAIARTLIETYEALAYIACESLQADEQDFRIALWKLHSEERRAEMLRLIGTNNPEEVAIQRQVFNLRESILSHPFLPQVNKDLSERLRKGDTPPYHLSRALRDNRSGINHDYHKAVIMHLSSHVHTHPFSVHQLFEFNARQPECLTLMSIAIQYSTGFLAKAIVGMIEIFTPRVPELTPQQEKVLDRWVELLKNGIKML